MTRILAAIAAVLLLAGCTPAGRALIDQGVEQIKQTEDAKARLALQAPCSITIGAKNRSLSEAEQRAVEALCGGNDDRPVTIEDLRRFLADPPPR